MINDEQRRYAARRIRQFLSIPPDERPLDNDSVQTIGVLVETSFGENILARLAELIDRPTCNDVGDDFVFRCSECGCELDINDAFDEPTMWKDGVATVPEYCPKCGRMVKNGA